MIWSLVLSISIIVIILFYGLTSTIVATNNVVVLSTDFDDHADLIEIRCGFPGSHIWYRDRIVKYSDKALYVTVIASWLDVPGTKGDPFTISIPNTYGEIHAIYLQGRDHSDLRLLWSSVGKS